MELRLARPEDAEALADLRWRLKTADGAEAPEETYESFAGRYIAALLAGDWTTQHFVACDVAVPVGVMTLKAIEKELSPDRMQGQIGYLTNCYVRPEHRNSGRGTALLKSVVAHARTRKLELMLVWPSERAYPFYRRAGFVGAADPLVLTLEDRGDP